MVYSPGWDLLIWEPAARFPPVPTTNEPSNLWASQCFHLKYGLTIPVAPGPLWGQMRSCMGNSLAMQKGINTHRLNYLFNQEVNLHVVQNSNQEKACLPAPLGSPDPGPHPQSLLKIPCDSFLAGCIHLQAYAYEPFKKPKYTSLYTLLGTSLPLFKIIMKHIGHAKRMGEKEHPGPHPNEDTKHHR